MKSLLTTILLFVLCIVGQAQQQEQTFSVPASMLTEQQKAELRAKQVTNTIGNAKSWVGVGHEVGTAVNEALQAVTKNAQEFGQTGVGRLTIGIVVWKVIGNECTHIIMGTLFTAVWLPIWIWSYRKTCIPRSVLMRVNADKSKEYELINASSSSDPTGAAIAHGVAVLLLILTSIIMVFSY